MDTFGIFTVISWQERYYLWLFCFTEIKFLLRKETTHFQKEGKTISTVTFPENVFIPSRKTDKLPSETSLTRKHLSPFLLVATPYKNSPRSPQF